MLAVMFDRRTDTFHLGVWNDTNRSFAVWLTQNVPSGPIARKAFGDEIVNECLAHPGEVYQINPVFVHPNSEIENEFSAVA